LSHYHWGKADDRDCNYGHPKDMKIGKNLFCPIFVTGIKQKLNLNDQIAVKAMFFIFDFKSRSGLSIFFKSTSTSLFTGVNIKGKSIRNVQAFQ
jgi:hypothetical protein